MFANRNEVLTLAFQLLFKDDNMQQIARAEKKFIFLIACTHSCSRAVPIPNLFIISTKHVSRKS